MPDDPEVTVEVDVDVEPETEPEAPVVAEHGDGERINHERILALEEELRRAHDRIHELDDSMAAVIQASASVPPHVHPEYVRLEAYEADRDAGLEDDDSYAIEAPEPPADVEEAEPAGPPRVTFKW